MAADIKELLRFILEKGGGIVNDGKCKNIKKQEKYLAQLCAKHYFINVIDRGFPTQVHSMHDRISLQLESDSEKVQQKKSAKNSVIDIKIVHTLK